MGPSGVLRVLVYVIVLLLWAHYTTGRGQYQVFSDMTANLTENLTEIGAGTIIKVYGLIANKNLIKPAGYIRKGAYYNEKMGL
jgi:hypothetical protein